MVISINNFIQYILNKYFLELLFSQNIHYIGTGNLTWYFYLEKYNFIFFQREILYLRNNKMTTKQLRNFRTLYAKLN